MSTWTSQNVTDIKNLFFLDYKYVRQIEEALTDFENQYGATAIADIQAKITSAKDLRAKIAAIEQSGDYGVTSQSVPNFYSFTRKQGTEVSGYYNALNSLKQSIISELRIENIARINVSKIIRA